MQALRLQHTFHQTIRVEKIDLHCSYREKPSVTCQLAGDERPRKHGLEEVGQNLAHSCFTRVELSIDQPRTVWVATLSVHVPKLEGARTVALQLNAPTWEQATEIYYFLTNAPEQLLSPAWVATTYSQRNWIKVFYREAKGWLGWSEYQVRNAISMKRHAHFGLHRLHLYPLASVNWRVSQALGYKT